MTLKLTIGLTKKQGQPDFGSIGATCHVEVAIDASMIYDDTANFQREVALAFDQCRRAVDEELNRSSATTVPRTTPAAERRSVLTKASGQPTATEKQIRAIHAIANKQRLDLVQELVRRFNVERADDLSVKQASQLIDAIKPQTTAA